MLVYCLKAHHVRFVACLKAFKSTQARLGRDFRFAFPFLMRDSLSK